ncbi:DEAD/DEAH box helicase [Streptosporangium sp. CA-115845]|uniref:DEAD/DEAH box helicase n=1 Tax=Streptosporangium sp. CA-115845 TaxID=3240071 RepID=UPI003D89D358
MLRDLIAAIVVERAQRLSELSHPGDAFTTTHRWISGKYNRVVRAWREDLTGFEIVIASANNGAVQNVTLEVPGKDAVHPEWHDTADYFADIASRVLGQPAWGLGAACLGRKTYRQDFVHKAWYGYASTDEPGLLDMLKAWETGAGSGGSASWGDAVESFRRAVQRVRLLQEERSQIHRCQQELLALNQRIEPVRVSISAHEVKLVEAHRQLGAVESTLATAQEEAAHWLRKRQEHQQFQPSLTTALFSLGKATREWRAEGQPIVQTQQAAQSKLDHAETAHKAIEESVTRISRDLDADQRHLSVLCHQATRLQTEIDRLSNGIEDFVPKDAWWSDEAARELAAPWTDPEWNIARTELFFEALRLHQAFMRAEATTLRRNLWGAVDVLTGAAPRDTAEDAIRAAWQSLFFVVPVVSSTFSSIDRMFSHLTRESLGWLFIDEAGQATPQAAVGAIWRSRRVVAVGDPSQLEPIVTLPFTSQQALRRTFRVAEERRLPARTSVQQLADHSNAYGTYLPGDDEPVWVGAPLRVHRRCDQPMFDISNTIAYDGLMVYGKRPSDALDRPTSKWIDIVSTESHGHWIPQEGEALVWVLKALVGDYAVAPEDILVIAPFREVARNAARLVAPCRKIKAGTVHTAQGKEAEVVVLILGGDPSKPGAKGWAAQRPNLLNVAVSRARRRLYVIGNRTEWARHRHFDVLAANLGIQGDRPTEPLS